MIYSPSFAFDRGRRGVTPTSSYKTDDMIMLSVLCVDDKVPAITALTVLQVL